MMTAFVPFLQCPVCELSHSGRPEIGTEGRLFGAAVGTSAPGRNRSEKRDCFVARAPRNDVKTSTRHLAAQCARAVHEICPSGNRGRGECRAPMHPQPRV